MCFGNKAAKRQAAAMELSAQRQATNDQYSAQAAAQAKTNTIAMEQAAARAAELLTQPQAKAEVALSENVPAAEIDPETGRRRTTRSSFQMARKTGLNL